MKKNYIKPISEVYHVKIQTVIAASSLSMSSASSDTSQDALVEEEFATSGSIWEEEW